MKDGKKYILVADDDREIREIVGLLLSSEGYAVLTAEDGIQAARLASGEIDLYLPPEYPIAPAYSRPAGTGRFPRMPAGRPECRPPQSEQRSLPRKGAD